MRRRARATSTRCSRSARSGRSRRGDRRGHRRRPRMRVLRDGELVGDMPVRRARRRLPALRPRSRPSPTAPIYPPPTAALSARRRPARDAAGAARPAPTSPRAGRSSSSTTRSSQSRTVRRPEQADAAVLGRCPDGAPLARRIDGNGRRVAADPYRGTVEAVLECAANLACVGAEPLGLDQLPQLRQPREAPHRLAADRVGARARRRLPRAGGTDRRRQRVALQRGRRRPDLPDPGHRHGRPAARRPPRRAGSASAARATRSRSSGPFAPSLAAPPSSRSCAGSRCPTACRRSTCVAVAAADAPSATRCARARSQRPRHRRGRPRDRARRVLPRRRARRERRLGDGYWESIGPGGDVRAPNWPEVSADAALFGEAPGGFLVSGPEAGAAGSAARRCAPDRPASAGERLRDRRGAVSRSLDARAERAGRRPRRRPGRVLPVRAAPSRPVRFGAAGLLACEDDA